MRVLIYAGDVDFICNWIGNKAWTKALPWTGARAFSAEADHTWFYASSSDSATVGGLARTAKAAAGEGSLTFLQVYEAGHMVSDCNQSVVDMMNCAPSVVCFI